MLNNMWSVIWSVVGSLILVRAIKGDVSDKVDAWTQTDALVGPYITPKPSSEYIDYNSEDGVLL